ncbi:hypothetical protein VE02_01796 [Pseudogymnoascus sp. 03VT05]|nr:hypothetical protein VE02_01796 [Pseudogymnoascus sp. 03VT05]
MSSSWNIPLFSEVVNAISLENRVHGVRWVYSPELDLAREPKFGSVGEMYGEDPYLVSGFEVAHVKNMQSPDANGTLRVATTVKHFVYGSSTVGVNLAPMVGGINGFYNIYSVPFRAVIKEANPAALMPSYSAYDDVPTTSNIAYTNHFLGEELWWDGTANDIQTAGIHALEASIGHEIGGTSSFGTLATLGNNPKIASLVKTAARRMLTLKFETGLFENPLPDLAQINSTVQSAAHLALNLNILKESMVLLKNDGILPIKTTGNLLSKVAVIGPLSTYINAGSYAADDYLTGSTVLRGIEGIAKEATFSKGCFVNNDTNVDAMIADAVKTAEAAELFYDHADLGFPGPQLQLHKAIAATGVPIIVIISGGQAFEMEYAVANSNAIIHTFLQGDLGGEAVASLITRDTNPSGKLTISIPKHSRATPIYYNYLPINRKDGIYTPTDWQWLALNSTARYPFGFGLSYTTFSFSNVQVSNYTSTSGNIVVSSTVKNTGNVAGQEVVQVYFGQAFPVIERSIKNLIRFTKINLEPGASQQVSFTIPVEELGYYGNGKKQVDADTYTFWVGSSSDDADLQSRLSLQAHHAL